MKLRVLAASLAALTLTAGIATAQTKPAPAKAPAAKPAAAAPAAGSTAMPVVDKNHVSYAFGWQLGQELANTGEPIDIATVVRGVQDAYAKKQPAYTEQQLGTAYTGFQKRMEIKAQEAFRKALADNQAQSADFVTKFKAQTGVITLPSGIMYRVAKAGTGAKPTATSEVQIAFRSFLAAVGVPLSGVQTPPPFKVADAPIPALKETLPLMQEGTVFEVVIPAGKGLGGGQNEQFAQQAVALQIELGAVK
ncbi:MAG TPA: FKBP-type peptidyl-prolyl cis-trans isomerase N-terminal domain-containing protein [Thermomonas sp.]|mgnify:CR=1 FL=1|jgi:FKBP-type peptidyl-prolyl cis-trans isomerase|uniref:FKBP-type peptidyl-prolyl cis-trans isomerase N-terminal domain-containing protein n=1 Tax=Thermomonas sp. TaxID=1971895 RepID=UPI002C251A5C|nr:FKBP-type peptidyl-prolyl cis-trans isomerase N-terminal domain-containing protein [Thermomonas sp.]HOV96352.1 FKBP-type peptidyl-prolyl cis-trans isomerase N-terminal domain-containing protein [Thermomonas sp.]